MKYLKKFNEHIDSSDVKLTSLEGVPNNIKGDLKDDKLTSLEGVPNNIKGDLKDAKLTSLENIPKHVGGKIGIYGYPSLDEVEAADHEQICKWYRHLPSPGDKVPHTLSNYRELVDEQVTIMNLICDKYKSGGGFNSSLSKKIGW